ncbi:MAG TPA: amidohydrolase family protein [Candidatus Polarisedimenticolia bacterium]|nr:amidohydrolase family protein [Candidatus Polarisedimenticolia bacterium]
MTLTITDVHVHMQPWETFRPVTLERMRRGRPDFDAIIQMSRDPAVFLRYLDSVGVERAALINYPAPDIMGFGEETNEFVTRYAAAAPDRLIAVGGVHPRLSTDPGGDVERLADRGIRALKLHPPHMRIQPEEYVTGGPAGEALSAIYAAAARRRLPVIVHTGTSIFPGARSRLGDPIGLDDVAVDHPDLRIVMAHGGRPIWMATCFFLMRRHPNVWLDISGIPPGSLPQYFPRLAEISGRVLFGTDWPSPGVKDIGANAAALQALPDSYLDAGAKRAILHDNSLRLFPA